MQYLKLKRATLLCILTLTLTTTACDLLELDDLNNSSDVSYHDTTTDAGDPTTDTTPNDASNEDDDENDDLTTRLSKFTNAYSKARNHHFCHVGMVCPETDPERVDSMSPYQTYKNCLENSYWSGTPDALANEQVAIEAGRLVFNKARAAECLQAIEQAASICDWDTFQTYDPNIQTPCDDVFTPHQDDGEECFSDNECFSGECGRDSDMCELSTCDETRLIKSPAKEGESCTNTTCEPGLFCEFVRDPETNTGEQFCNPLNVLEETEDCSVYGTICGPGLVCYHDLCLPTPNYNAEGESCDRFTELCKTGLTCRETVDFNTLECVPHSDLDEECGTHLNCRRGLYCEFNETDYMGTCTNTIDDYGPCTDDQACGEDGYCETWDDEPTCSYYADNSEDSGEECSPL